MRRRGWGGCCGDSWRKKYSPLACFSKDLFVDATERRGLMGLWLEWGWIGDVSNLAYSK
jgi:hypothetical protein